MKFNATLCALAALSLMACGDDGGGGGGGGGSAGGTITEEWESFCSATLTEDMAVKDVFDDVLFTAKAGDTYLMSDYETFAGETRAELLYLHPQGVVDFRIAAPEGEPLPLESNCEVDSGLKHQAVFVTTTFYTDEGLGAVACELEAGTSGAGGGGSVLVSELDFNNPNAPATYQVTMGGLAAACNDITETYVRAAPFQAFGTTYAQPPVDFVLAPAE